MESEAIRSLISGLRSTANAAETALAQPLPPPPPVVTSPPPTPAPTPTPTPSPSPSSGKVAVWTGMGEWPDLEPDKGAMTFGDLASAFDEIVCILGGSAPAPDWVSTWFSQQSVPVRVGFYGGIPRTPAQQADFLTKLDDAIRVAKACGSKRVAADLENYGQGTEQEAWDGTVAERALMQAFGAVVSNHLAINGVHLACYGSTAVGWPGAWVDLVERINNVDFSMNLFPWWWDGVLSVSTGHTFIDPTFDFGPQVSGYNWATAQAESIRRTMLRFPHGTASTMLWPDITEHRSPFSPDEFRTALAGAMTVATGPVMVYEQHLEDNPTWLAQGGYLDVVRSVVG